MNIGSKQDSSMIHSASNTVPQVAIIIFTLKSIVIENFEKWGRTDIRKLVISK